MIMASKLRPRPPTGGDNSGSTNFVFALLINCRCRRGVAAEAAARIGAERGQLADSAASLAACRVFFDFLSEIEYAKARGTSEAKMLLVIVVGYALQVVVFPQDETVA